MGIGTRSVPETVHTVLQSVEFDGDVGRLTCGTLERSVYQQVDKVLKSLGGKWDRRKGGHVFPGDARDHLEAVIETGQYVDAKQALGFFETPESLADEVASMAAWPGGMVPSILEPSAGSGNLLRAMVRRYGERALYDTVAVEIDGRHHAVLSDLAAEVHIADFLSLTLDVMEGGFDRVVMNPPFSRQQDIDHVLHAWQFLAPGGRLVAIMSAGWTFRENRKSREFRTFITEHGGIVHHHDHEAFRESGTGVRTVDVTLTKPD